MADPIETGLYGPSSGSLTGFDSISLPSGAVELPRVGWSIEMLRAFLLNEDGANFPTEDQMRQINTLINTHLNDFNNPHHVTLDQLDHNFIEEVLGAVIPGTPPEIAPFFAYDAVCSLPLGDVFPATWSNTNSYRMTEGGVFTNTATESEVIGTDYITNNPGLPLFSSLTNLVPAGWATQSGILVNTAMTPATMYPGLPFSVYQLSETNVSGSFGIAIPLLENLSTVYTMTVFLIPLTTGGSVVISQPSDSANHMTVNLADGSYTVSSATVIGETFVYPSGEIRVSFSFLSRNPTVDGVVQFLHLNNGDTTTSRAGQASRPLFQLSNPIATTSTLNQPVMVDSTKVATNTPLVLGLNKVPTPAYMANLLMTFTFNIYPSLPGAVMSDTHLLTFDSLTIERDATNIYVKLAGVVQFTSAILNGLNVITLSYSPTTLIFKDFAVARQTISGSYPMLSTASVTLGPCAGYLQSLAFYAQADRSECVEYLTNG